MTFTIWNLTMLKNEPFMSNRRFKKGTFLKKVRFYFFVKLFLHTFCQKQIFCYSTTFFESLITHKRFVFKESYISYGKRQKSCTLIVICVKCLYLTSTIFNSSAKSNRLFFIANEEVLYFAVVVGHTVLPTTKWVLHLVLGKKSILLGTHKKVEHVSFFCGKKQHFPFMLFIILETFFSYYMPLICCLYFLSSGHFISSK